MKNMGKKFKLHDYSRYPLSWCSTSDLEDTYEFAVMHNIPSIINKVNTEKQRRLRLIKLENLLNEKEK